jgi:large conductance mechanosensitive channel
MSEFLSNLEHAAEGSVKRGLNMWKEFKAFAVKGNAIDLAVGVVIGAAFTGVVNSLVKDIITPPLGMLSGGLSSDLANKFVLLKSGTGGLSYYTTPAAAAAAGAVTWNYGSFVTTLINFLIVSFSIFVLIQLLSKLKKPDAAAPVVKDCPFCAMSIPIPAQRCPHCTSELATAAR